MTKIYMYYKLGQACVTNWSSLFYYKLGQTLLKIGATLLLQFGASVVTNWGSYYKLGQSYYKIGQPLKIGAECITN